MDRVSRISCEAELQAGRRGEIQSRRSIVADRPGGQSVFVPRRKRRRGNARLRGSTQFHRDDLHGRFPDAVDTRQPRAKNFVPVNCNITLAGHRLRYFPSADLPCRVPLQAFRRVGRARAPLPLSTQGSGASIATWSRCPSQPCASGHACYPPSKSKAKETRHVPARESHRCRHRRRLRHRARDRERLRP